MINHTLNIGSGYETSIKDLALEISELVGFNGKINWDLNSANGATRKILNSNYINSLGWKAETSFLQDLKGPTTGSNIIMNQLGFKFDSEFLINYQSYLILILDNSQYTNY